MKVEMRLASMPKARHSQASGRRVLPSAWWESRKSIKERGSAEAFTGLQSLTVTPFGGHQGVAALAGEVADFGDDFAAGVALGDGEGLTVADGIAAGPGLLTGTLAEAASCHWPLRRTNVSIDRYCPLMS